jgi:hypothetical protein
MNEEAVASRWPDVSCRSRCRAHDEMKGGVEQSLCHQKGGPEPTAIAWTPTRGCVPNSSDMPLSGPGAARKCT